MGRQRVYGKKIGAATLASYNRFAADSSNGEISAENSILSSISVNIQQVRKDIAHSKVNRGHPKSVHRADLEALKFNQDVQTEGNTQRLQPSKQQAVRSGETQDETNLSRPTTPGSGCSIESKHISTTEQDPSKRSDTTRTPHLSKAPIADELSAMFSGLAIRASPDASIVVPKPHHLSGKDVETVSVPQRRYLQPILSCKNVTPEIPGFSSWMDARSHLKLEKVGEGSFGEVFRATSSDNETVILKLMPLNAMKGRGSKSFTSINSAANEIRLLERMQRVPGFVEFRGACVLVGNLPTIFVKLWNQYKLSGRTVESRDPSKKTSYSVDQLWLLLEMSDAGRNLEPGQYAPPGETAIKGHCYLGVGRAWDIFWEVVKSIAKAECWAHFEHRDLHMGNICVRDTVDMPDLEDLSLIRTSSPPPLRVNTSGVEVTVIDYSLSRAYMENEKDVLFYDIKKDKHLLKGEGDLQYDMYRYMAAAIGDRPSDEFVPETNLLWLWYLLVRILAMTKPLSVRARAKKRGFVTIEARKLGILQEVQQLIHPDAIEEWTIESAAVLLSFGIEQGWLLVDDVTR